MTQGENHQYTTRVALGLLFFLVCAIPALSQTPCQPTGSGICRYVSATGSDSNNGLTRTTPKQTIASTVNASSPGDEIIILAGTYNCANQPGVSPCTGGENSGTKLVNITASGTAANPIVVVCDSYLACKIDGQSDTGAAEGITLAGSYITVQNFEVEGFSDSGISNYGGGTHITINRNWVHDEGRYCTNTGIGRDGIFVYHSYVTITQNIISDNGRLQLGENGCNITRSNFSDHGIYADGAVGPTDLLVSNNIFYRNERGWSVHVYPGSWTNVSVLNNTFLYSMPSSVGQPGQIVVDASVTNLLIENNVGYQAYQAFIKAASGTVTGVIENNLIYGTSSVTTTTPSGWSGVTMTGNIVNTDPQLLAVGSSIIDNPSVPDAHLTSGSPAIKAGLTLAAVPDDFDGTARIPGAYDIGSYAFRLTSTVSPPINLQVVVH